MDNNQLIIDQLKAENENLKLEILLIDRKIKDSNNIISQIIGAFKSLIKNSRYFIRKEMGIFFALAICTCLTAITFVSFFTSAGDVIGAHYVVAGTGAILTLVTILCYLIVRNSNAHNSPDNTPNRTRRNKVKRIQLHSTSFEIQKFKRDEIDNLIAGCFESLSTGGDDSDRPIIIELLSQSLIRENILKTNKSLENHFLNIHQPSIFLDKFSNFEETRLSQSQLFFYQEISQHVGSKGCKAEEVDSIKASQSIIQLPNYLSN